MNDSVSELLRALAGVLGAFSLKWYLFGAQAVNIWGRPRMTADVDVTVQDPGPRRGALMDALGEAGFTLLLPAESVEGGPVIPLHHTATGFPLDLVIGSSGLEELFLSRTVPTSIGQVEVPVVAPADLLVLKLLAGRPKDLEDAAGIVRAQRDDLDLEKLRDLLGQVERALGQSDLLPALQRLLEG